MRKRLKMNTTVNLFSATYTQKNKISYHRVCYFACTKGNSVFLKTLKVNGKGDGAAVLKQVRTGPEGSSRLRLPDLKTIDT